VKRAKGDWHGSIADFRKVIELNPKSRAFIEAKGYLTNGTSSN